MLTNMLSSLSFPIFSLYSICILTMIFRSTSYFFLLLYIFSASPQIIRLWRQVVEIMSSPTKYLRLVDVTIYQDYFSLTALLGKQGTEWIFLLRKGKYFH